MYRCLLAGAFFLVLATSGVAQQSAADQPASKEDIRRYLKAVHAHEMMAQMVEAMAKPMHQMMHEQFLENRDKLSPDFEERMNKMMDDNMKGFPWDEMLDSMIPVYQKHLTKGDVDALVAFYASPTGQKILREMPSITAEAMQSMMPLLQKHVEEMTGCMQEAVTAMLKAADGKKTTSSPN
jgi:hypothetical protein